MNQNVFDSIRFHARLRKPSPELAPRWLVGAAIVVALVLVGLDARATEVAGASGPVHTSAFHP